jgi:uncharacterized membrane protein YdjX (TVP38/TMEM64 family)
MLTGFVLIFMGVSIFSKIFSQDLEALIEVHFPVGMIFYIVLLVFGEIFLPGSTLPLVPIAATLRGSLLAAASTFIGWMISAIIAFALARRYGRSLANRMINREKVEEIGGCIPERHLFWSVVLFRVIFPIDLVSYALGLFANIPWGPYLLSTGLGVGVFAFSIAHIVLWPLPYRLIAEAAGAGATVIGYIWLRSRLLSHLER